MDTRQLAYIEFIIFVLDVLFWSNSVSRWRLSEIWDAFGPGSWVSFFPICANSLPHSGASSKFFEGGASLHAQSIRAPAKNSNGFLG